MEQRRTRAQNSGQPKAMDFGFRMENEVLEVDSNCSSGDGFPANPFDIVVTHDEVDHHEEQMQKVVNKQLFEMLDLYNRVKAGTIEGMSYETIDEAKKQKQIKIISDTLNEFKGVTAAGSIEGGGKEKKVHVSLIESSKPV